MVSLKSERVFENNDKNNLGPEDIDHHSLSKWYG